MSWSKLICSRSSTVLSLPPKKDFPVYIINCWEDTNLSTALVFTKLLQTSCDDFFRRGAIPKELAMLFRLSFRR